MTSIPTLRCKGGLPDKNLEFKITIISHYSIVLCVATRTVESSLADNKGGDGVVCPSIKWLRDLLLPKLKKWAENPAGSSQGSLRLISLERYTILYQTLKEKYGWDLVKVHVHNCTEL